MLTRRKNKLKKSLNKIMILSEETFISMVLQEVKNLEKIGKAQGKKGGYLN